MKLKKFFALALAAATLALALTACGSKADDSADNSDANTDNQTGETVTVKLGVVGGIYDDLWASAKAALADEGMCVSIDTRHASVARACLDAGASIVTLLGFRLAGQKPDPEHPFGHGRLEYISGLIVTIVILLMGFELLRDAVGAILHPEAGECSVLTVAILLISICA